MQTLSSPAAHIVAQPFGTIAKFSRVLAALLITLALSLPASAHRSHKGGENAGGVSIPNLTHGQLRVVMQYRAAILGLADRQSRPDLIARTLQNFVNLQFSYCLWGLVPNSVSNEESPFNECSHAYLAATKALLDHLRQSREAREPANALAQKIELEMLENAAASVICGNGIAPFNTAQIVMPEWQGVTFNPLAILLGAFIMLPAAGVLVNVLNGRRAASRPS
jgi:hypothetical protein